ncbi:BQ5605_C030g10881 [Microbotryum silenes-dioicae]|uniref:BQ5605_C030g10870 protein n=1 Tax=Microbotryum silenes-dioicae TaxID=796604 RepID=A0A2X0PCG7_9BASI|nr:BQ5605_C030g10870 [Microbotryum silenes-dioicae]SGZ09544.1 BQ5605_C030g10881 [Microbotryum silenes-dioicae]
MSPPRPASIVQSSAKEPTSVGSDQKNLDHRRTQSSQSVDLAPTPMWGDQPQSPASVKA